MDVVLTFCAEWVWWNAGLDNSNYPSYFSFSYFHILCTFFTPFSFFWINLLSLKSLKVDFNTVYRYISIFNILSPGSTFPIALVDQNRENKAFYHWLIKMKTPEEWTFIFKSFGKQCLVTFCMLNNQ